MLSKVLKLNYIMVSDLNDLKCSYYLDTGTIWATFATLSTTE